MGEARQRRLAREAGRPWERDCSRMEPATVLLGTLSDDAEAETFRRMLERQSDAARLLQVPDTSRGLPVVGVRRGLDVLALLSTLALSGSVLVEGPERKRGR